MTEQTWGDTKDTLRDIAVFILLCAVVFGLAFAYIPQKKYEARGKSVVDMLQNQEIMPQGLPSKDEQERLRQDIETIQRNIAAKNKQGADTLAPQYVHIGGIYEALGLLPQARNAYMRAIEEDKKSIDAFTGLGNVYVREKRYPEAEATYRAGLSLNEKDIHGYLVLGNFYAVIMKDEDTARTTYLRGLLTTNNDIYLARAYANFLETIGRNYEAYLYWSEVVKGNPEDTVAKEHVRSLRPSVEEAIRATEQGSIRVKK